MRASVRRATAVVAGLLAVAMTASGCTPTTSRAAADSLVAIPGADLSEDTVGQLESAVNHAIAASGATGALVAVWIPWAGAWVEGLGTTGPDSDEPVTTDMHFRIGDITRAMTCDVLYELADEGVVALDDPVTEWVTSVPNLSDITLQQLCDGTSGLGDGRARLDYQFNATPERVWNPREIAAAGIADRGRVGVEVRDSDAAYVLLGMALEGATRESAQELFAEHVTEPLDLDGTELPSSAPAAPGDPALPGYISFRADRAEGCVAPSEYTTISSSMGFTDSGATSTITDLARYGQSLAMGAVDGDGELGERWSKAMPFEDAEYVGGAYLAGSMIGQKGSASGYLTSVYADTETGMTVAVALNNSAASADLAGALAKELAAIASKAPAADGQEQPEFGLPWTAEDFHQVVAEKAVCPID
ncbi:serine hydrolase [Microbacterium betulae]|uniref:Serine hydrolase n=1 Tax=Microbacterium betulae TaxID=2981139 RepID=A0AA97I697_9MICO|nr:serine hydrolase domain-containing protein [Microbacterium sp. AB]WOF22917.1 serine hydrolase [Microbacterium sp. AB]